MTLSWLQYAEGTAENDSPTVVESEKNGSQRGWLEDGSNISVLVNRIYS